VASGQGQIARSAGQAPPMQAQNSNPEPGRSTPPTGGNNKKEDLTSLDQPQVVARYEELSTFVHLIRYIGLC